MMKCPICEELLTVVETRINAKGLRRRRKCIYGHKFTTLEAIVPYNEGRTEQGWRALVKKKERRTWELIVSELVKPLQTHVIIR